MRDFTDFQNNAVGIDPAGCGCTDCILGHSVPLDGYGMTELAEQAVLGRPLVNRTSLPLALETDGPAIRVVPEDHPHRWMFSPDRVQRVCGWTVGPL